MNSILLEQYEAIKSAINIVEVIGQFEILKKKGRNYFCKCPFHNENTASFSVSTAKGIYTCFGGCGSGDAIKFVQLHLKLDFKQAMRWLAEFYNLPLNDNEPREFDRPRPKIRIRPATETPAADYITKETFNKSLSRYDENNFVKFLHTLFDNDVVENLIEKYYIGTSKYYPGGCVFWQIDTSGHIRDGKVMQYNPATGRRNKDVTPTWAGFLLKGDTYNREQCFYGLHLLADDETKPVAIVESEKTATVCSVFLPEFIWVALGRKGYEQFNKKTGTENEPTETLRKQFKELAGRDVVLFPDNDALADWINLAYKLSDITAITVNDLLQVVAQEHNLPDKCDLCDFLTSEAAQKELVDNFREAFINATDSYIEQSKVCTEYQYKGLKKKDQLQALYGLINEGVYSVVD